MICTVPSLAHPDGLYPFLNRVSFPHNKTPKVFCPTFGVHYILYGFLFVVFTYPMKEERIFYLIMLVLHYITKFHQSQQRTVGGACGL